ncbi:semaphorin-5B-like isoform X2 [Paramacrobiotus metropolitanus]|uniref:semaphorin-5B-like isoform X2 n=1 Tax=Paramacrobiotus metropolitanus TaxID=2943436 RepID=UPI002445E968|nr:semaphorin-5B-like isoform X2 [Paramacrobiotus metropolitanus]
MVPAYHASSITMAELPWKNFVWAWGDVPFIILLFAIKLSLLECSHDSNITGDVLRTFSLENGSDFRQILYDPVLATNILHVGGREALYKLRADNLDIINLIPWEANETDRENCRIKGYADQEGCLNYVTVLLKSGDGNKLFVCGNNAFNPVCTWRKADDLNQELSREDGALSALMSPFPANVSIATYTARSGDLYFGSRFAWNGLDPGFHRYSPQSAVPIIRTPKNSALWVDDAYFVEIFEKGPFAYVFFRETAREFFSKSNEKKPVYSRIARVCQNDIGTSKVTGVQWTTFQKARIECPLRFGSSFDRSASNDDSFDQVQQIAILNDNAEQLVTPRTVFAGIFNTPGHSLFGAALCVYEMRTIERVFDGSYQEQPNTASMWQKLDTPEYRNFNCSVRKDSQGRNVTVLDLKFASDPRLMFESVGPGIGPLFDKPVVIEEMTQFHFLQAERISIGNDHFVYVFYVITSHKDIRKYVLDPADTRSGRACIVAAWTSLFKPLESILTMKLLTKQQALIIGTSQRVIRLSNHACYEHSNERSCIDSGDPHCGWDSLRQMCRAQPEGDKQHNTGWTRSRLDNCHSNTIFPAWDEQAWYPCKEDGSHESCQCRSRKCIGSQCHARQFQMTNCTRHGGWTDYSSWSECSRANRCQQNRTRSCTKPLPQFGGNDCEGSALDSRSCDVGECEAKADLRMAVPLAAPVMSGARFQDWGPWSECSRSCGRGTQRRTRSCMLGSPTGKCDGPQVESKDCNVEDCPPMTKIGSWSIWISDPHKGSAEAFDEHRFQCVAIMNGTELEVNLKHNKRECPNARACHTGRVYDARVEASWSPWMECNHIGVQERFYDCKGAEQRPCPAFEQQATEDTSWGCWSDWSPCTNNEQSRHRICIKDSKACRHGESTVEARVCKLYETASSINQAAAYGSLGYTGYLIVGCVLSFLAGTILTLSIVTYRQKRKSNPHNEAPQYPMAPYMERQPVQLNTYAIPPGHHIPNGESKDHDTDHDDYPETQAFVPSEPVTPKNFERGAPMKASFRGDNFGGKPAAQRQFSTSQKSDQYFA